jgi:hypothetical protein
MSETNLDAARNAAFLIEFSTEAGIVGATSCRPRRALRDLLDPDVRRDDGKHWSSFQRMRFSSSNACKYKHRDLRHGLNNVYSALAFSLQTLAFKNHPVSRFARATPPKEGNLKFDGAPRKRRQQNAAPLISSFCFSKSF